MSVSAKSLDSGHKIEVIIQGRFDGNDHTAFREAYKTERSDAEYIINMQQAEYLDSSALGMLMLLREHAGSDAAQVSIINTPDDIKEVLKMSNFETLFTIS